MASAALQSDSLMRRLLIVFFAGLLTLPVASVPSAASPYSACPTVEEEIVDLDMLTAALRETKAIGTLAKIRARSDIKKMLSRLEMWHDKKSKFTIYQLEEQYHLLLMKIAIMIHDDDLALHQQLCNAWAGIWLDLKDPDKFRQMRSGKKA